MPTAAKKRSAKKTARASARKKPTSVRLRRTTRPNGSAGRAAGKSKTKKIVARAKAPKIKITGRVVHFYDRIGVAIVELAAPLRLGDMVVIKNRGEEFVQLVDSIQIDHKSVEVAKKKDVIGMRVMMPVKEGALVLPV